MKVFFDSPWEFDLISRLQNYHEISSPRDLLDVLLVAIGVYWLLLLIRGTRAVQVLVGLLVLIGVSVVSRSLELTATGWILNNFSSSAVIFILVVFQQDIRRALARMGRGVFQGLSRRERTQILEEVVRAAQTLVQRRTGALIVLERETQLGDLVQTGIFIDAVVGDELLVAIFSPHSPLHDGAALIQDGRITQAGCILPLTLRDNLPASDGTRHRAAVGITEESDAVVLVISEETASISVVFGGEIVRGLGGPRLREVLRDLLGAPPRLGGCNLGSAGPRRLADPISLLPKPWRRQRAARGPRRAAGRAAPPPRARRAPRCRATPAQQRRGARGRRCRS